MRKMFFLVGIVVVAVLAGCAPVKEEKNRCKPPPQGFTETDLVGTWVKKHLDLRSDTLIIKEDGTYKQIIHLEAYSVDYESDWLPWYIEYTDDDIPYLHMEGLRLCAHVPDLRGCDQAGGGDYDWNAFNSGEWFDYCHDKWMVQKGEGILLVNGAVYDGWTDEGIELASLSVSPLDSWVYRLQRQELPTPTLP
jgi:hypothetical protein